MSTHLFSATGYCPDITLLQKDQEKITFDSLPPFLRALLTTDGTVTTSLESYYWEPVNVANVRQLACDDIGKIDPNILLGDQEDYLIRNIDLIGKKSGARYLSANSQFAIGRLPVEIRNDLETMRIGIGEILLGRGLETYRKIVDMGVTENDEKSIWRRYLIYIEDKPVISIVETFNVSVFE